MHAHAVPAQGALLVRATTVATPRASFSRKSVAVPKAKVRQTAVATASCTDTPSSRASAVTAAVSACWASLATALVTAMPAMAEEAVSAASGGIPWYAGAVDVAILGLVGVLVVQGNNKAKTTAAAPGKNAKANKKR
tara:strand:+ start:6263 stop:6673 length:411 start_codon:yes stop_codon:yes gene_type:complete